MVVVVKWMDHQRTGLDCMDTALLLRTVDGVAFG